MNIFAALMLIGLGLIVVGMAIDKTGKSGSFFWGLGSLIEIGLITYAAVG